MKSAEGNIMNDLKAVLTDAEELLRAKADQAGPKIQDAREHLKGMGAELETKVRANPLVAVGIAAGVGLVIGLLLSRHHGGHHK